MTPHEFQAGVLTRGLDKIATFAPQMPRNRAVEVLMTAISGVEADWASRVQIPSGEAHSLFQIQRNAIVDIMKNPASADIFELGMNAWGINTRTPGHLFDLIATPEGDTLAVFLARLLLWCNPEPIPDFDDSSALFSYYADTWRPAVPNWRRWEACFGDALSVVPG